MIPVLTRILAAGAVATAFGSSLFAPPALAENTKLRLAYLMADSMLSVMVAKDAGEYEAAGIDLEIFEAQGGPAVVAALASGSADLGYSAPIPPINARMNGVPLKLVLALGHEKAPDMQYTGFVASKASGIADVAGVKGRKIALNANGGLCELAWRDHLAAAGLTWEDVQPVVLPFPQIEAALQQGAIDAACVVNPFYAAIMHNPDIGAVEIATGMLADLTTPGLSDVIFANESYIAEHPEAIRAFAEVTEASRARLLADKELLTAAAEKYVGLTPEAARDVRLPVARESTVVELSDVQYLLDALERHGMMTAPITAEDLTANFGQ